MQHLIRAVLQARAEQDVVDLPLDVCRAAADAGANTAAGWFQIDAMRACKQFATLFFVEPLSAPDILGRFEEHLQSLIVPCAGSFVSVHLLEDLSPSTALSRSLREFTGRLSRKGTANAWAFTVNCLPLACQELLRGHCDDIRAYLGASREVALMPWILAVAESLFRQDILADVESRQT